MEGQADSPEGRHGDGDAEPCGSGDEVRGLSIKDRIGGDGENEEVEQEAAADRCVGHRVRREAAESHAFEVFAVDEDEHRVSEGDEDDAEVGEKADGVARKGDHDVQADIGGEHGKSEGGECPAGAGGLRFGGCGVHGLRLSS